mmetsp:Transcript_14440/g.32378  ORF Transcript_14440/g.32378 Transcript_14440/m.32378 type:complete len:1028 (+) Transcript_14440:117-3200(+)
MRSRCWPAAVRWWVLGALALPLALSASAASLSDGATHTQHGSRQSDAQRTWKSKDEMYRPSVRREAQIHAAEPRVAIVVGSIGDTKDDFAPRRIDRKDPEEEDVDDELEPQEFELLHDDALEQGVDCTEEDCAGEQVPPRQHIPRGRVPYRPPPPPHRPVPWTWRRPPPRAHHGRMVYRVPHRHPRWPPRRQYRRYRRVPRQSMPQKQGRKKYTPVDGSKVYQTQTRGSPAQNTTTARPVQSSAGGPCQLPLEEVHNGHTRDELIAKNLRREAYPSYCVPGDWVPNLQQCTTSCVRGYAPDKARLSCVNGQFNTSMFKCQQGCRPQVGNLTVCESDKRMLRPGEKCLQLCDANINTARVLTCAPDGLLRGTTSPLCSQVKCMVPRDKNGALEKGIKSCPGGDGLPGKFAMTPGGQCSLTCQESYVPIANTLHCHDDGTLYPTKPKRTGRALSTDRLGGDGKNLEEEQGRRRWRRRRGQWRRRRGSIWPERRRAAPGGCMKALIEDADEDEIVWQPAVSDDTSEESEVVESITGRRWRRRRRRSSRRRRRSKKSRRRSKKGKKGRRRRRRRRRRSRKKERLKAKAQAAATKVIAKAAEAKAKINRKLGRKTDEDRRRAKVICGFHRRREVFYVRRRAGGSTATTGQTLTGQAKGTDFPKPPVHYCLSPCIPIRGDGMVGCKENKELFKHKEICTLTCYPGYTTKATKLVCNDGVFEAPDFGSPFEDPNAARKHEIKCVKEIPAAGWTAAHSKKVGNNAVGRTTLRPLPSANNLPPPGIPGQLPPDASAFAPSPLPIPGLSTAPATTTPSGTTPSPISAVKSGIPALGKTSGTPQAADGGPSFAWRRRRRGTPWRRRRRAEPWESKAVSATGHGTPVATPAPLEQQQKQQQQQQQQKQQQQQPPKQQLHESQRSAAVVHPHGVSAQARAYGARPGYFPRTMMHPHPARVHPIHRRAFPGRIPYGVRPRYHMNGRHRVRTSVIHPHAPRVYAHAPRHSAPTHTRIVPSPVHHQVQYVPTVRGHFIRPHAR